jgi:hypothetical protein
LSELSQFMQTEFQINLFCILQFTVPACVTFGVYYRVCQHYLLWLLEPNEIIRNDGNYRLADDSIFHIWRYPQTTQDENVMQNQKSTCFRSEPFFVCAHAENVLLKWLDIKILNHAHILSSLCIC